MFEKNRSVVLQPSKAYTDACLSMLKRIKIFKDGFLICENDYEFFVVRHIDSQGKEISKWSVKVPNGLLSDYIYVKDTLYMSFVNILGEYEETFSIYRSDDNGDMVEIFSANRESYQHDMDYFYMFAENNECRLLLIKHNRVHLYSIGSPSKEINILEGQKWYISGGYVLCAMGRDWELYDSSLELVTAFKFEEDADWLDIKSSKDGDLVAIATNNSVNEVGVLFVFDRKKDDFELHYQRYGFYNIAICGGRIWSTVGSIYSGLGGLMIFDKTASLRFAHLRDEIEGETLRAYHPDPIVYQTSLISELPESKVLMVDYDRIIVTDITCRPLQEIKHQGYDCIAISEDMKTIALLNLENRLLSGQPEQEYQASIDIYTWDCLPKKGRVVNLTSFRK